MESLWKKRGGYQLKKKGLPGTIGVDGADILLGFLPEISDGKAQEEDRSPFESGK